jgi:hypothetical protein
MSDQKYVVVERYERSLHATKDNPHLRHRICRVIGETALRWLVEPVGTAPTFALHFSRDSQRRHFIPKHGKGRQGDGLNLIFFDSVEQAQAYAEAMFARWNMICTERDEVVLPLKQQINLLCLKVSEADGTRDQKAAAARYSLSKERAGELPWKDKP